MCTCPFLCLFQTFPSGSYNSKEEEEGSRGGGKKTSYVSCGGRREKAHSVISKWMLLELQEVRERGGKKSREILN